MSVDHDPVPPELQDGDVVLEVGAYEGAWVLKVCEQCPNCKVYAFEPATRAYQIARKKLKDEEGVILRNVALGKANGEADLCDCLRDGANTLDFNPEDEPSESVSVVDVAEVVEPLGEIALAHLNAEGGELEILERLIETGLIDRLKMVLVQWHPYDLETHGRIVSIGSSLVNTHHYEARGAWGCWKRIERQCDE